MVNWATNIYGTYAELEAAIESVDNDKTIVVTPIFKDNRQQYVLSIGSAGLTVIDGGTP